LADEFARVDRDGVRASISDSALTVDRNFTDRGGFAGAMGDRLLDKWISVGAEGDLHVMVGLWIDCWCRDQRRLGSSMIGESSSNIQNTTNPRNLEFLMTIGRLTSYNSASINITPTC
jgi:hypothetical protein